CHQPGAAYSSRGACDSDSAATASIDGGRRTSCGAAPERGSAAFHRAGGGGLGQVRVDPLQPRRGRKPVPAARRIATGDRTGGRKNAGSLGGGDAREYHG